MMSAGIRITGGFFLFAIAICFNAHPQIYVSQKASLSLSANTTLTLGEMRNEGTIVNNGHLKVSGQWVNSGDYQSGQGLVTFNGSSKSVPQVIHHNGQYFHTLDIAGGTRKVLLSDVKVTSRMRFYSGVVEAAGNARVTFAPDVIITGASDSSHVHGVVYQEGSGYKLFPIGDGVAYLPVELMDVKEKSSLIGVRALRFGNMLPVLPVGFDAMSPDFYWHLDVARGSISSPIVLPLQNASWAASEDDIVVVQSETMTAGFTSIGRLDNKDLSQGRIGSAFAVTKPFVALASAANDELTVYNAVSNNGDGLNEFLRIENIEHYWPNKFSVFNRWGDKVFEVVNYDNNARAFRGRTNISGDEALPSGTYFYVLEIPGRESLRGYISVRN